MRAQTGLSEWSGGGTRVKKIPARLISRKRGLPDAAGDDLTVR